jgi:hypothetical protein
MQTAKLCFLVIKECGHKDFKYRTLLSELASAVIHYFTSNALQSWWLKKGKNE